MPCRWRCAGGELSQVNRSLVVVYVTIGEGQTPDRRNARRHLRRSAANSGAWRTATAAWTVGYHRVQGAGRRAARGNPDEVLSGPRARSLFLFRERRRPVADPLADRADLLRGETIRGGRGHPPVVVVRGDELEQVRLLRPPGDDHLTDCHQQAVVQDFDPAARHIVAVALV